MSKEQDTGFGDPLKAKVCVRVRVCTNVCAHASTSLVVLQPVSIFIFEAGSLTGPGAHTPG